MKDGGGGGFGGHDGGFGGGHHGGIGGGHHNGGVGGFNHHHQHSTGSDLGSGQIPPLGVQPIRLRQGPGGATRSSLMARYVSAAVFLGILLIMIFAFSR